MLELNNKYIIGDSIMKIGFYDSGLGGAKTLKDIIDMGLSGDIYYLADTKNCPYGTKSISELKAIIDENIEFLIKLGCKIIVVACNTATSVDIKDLREKYKDIFFIGTEPAVKPALDDIHKKILVLATTRTINGDKLKELIGDNTNDVLLKSTDELVTMIENKDTIRINKYLNEVFSEYDLNSISHIVLGCTHFPIVKDNILDIVGKYGIKVIDGNIGIGRNLLKRIPTSNKLNVKVILTKKNEEYINKLKGILDNTEFMVK